jgi:glutamate synthase (NADPH/NADH) small chain
VLGINNDPVTIKQVELEIIDHAWDNGWVTPKKPTVRTGKRVVVIGSGPAGPRLRAAAHPRRARGDRARARRPHRRPPPLRHPRVQDGEAPPRARIEQMEARAPSSARTPASGETVDIEVLLASYDAIVLAGGATAWRDLPVPGRELRGIHQAMEYLPWANKVQEGDLEQSPIDVAASTS